MIACVSPVIAVVVAFLCLGFGVMIADMHRRDGDR